MTVGKGVATIVRDTDTETKYRTLKSKKDLTSLGKNLTQGQTTSHEISQYTMLLALRYTS